jgi:hypothetical protein
MSFLTWFSGESRQIKASANKAQKRAAAGREKSAVALPQQLATEEAAAGRSENRKVKRHARREQLYVAIREAMTRAGVLSASYKFKVLSLDQQGNEFLVMMDLATAYAGPPARPGEIEALIVQNAKARFEITVSAVYWRMDEADAVSKPKPGAQAVAPMVTPMATPKTAKPTAPRYEPIELDEVAAFKQALLAASAQAPAAAHGVKPPRGPRSYTLLTGFEDTEMHESAASPALSTTQYGDLM